MIEEQSDRYLNEVPSNQENTSTEDLTVAPEELSDRNKRLSFDTIGSVHGDFVGRDVRVFNIESSLINPINPKSNSHVDLIGSNISHIDSIPNSHIDSIPNSHVHLRLERTLNQIQRLRGKITQIIPTQERILVLQYLHNVSIIQKSLPIKVCTRTFDRQIENKIPSKLFYNGIKSNFSFLFPSFSRLLEIASFDITDLTSGLVKKIVNSFDIFAEETRIQIKSIAEENLDELHKIEINFSAEGTSNNNPDLLQKLSKIIDNVNIQIARLDAEFKSIIHSSRTSRLLIENMASKINHTEYKNEAQMHLSIVSGLASRLEENDELLDSNDVLSNDVWFAIGVMIEIEQRRITVERLISLDRRAKRFTVMSVTLYLMLLILALSLIYFFSGVPPIAGQSLDQLKIRLFEIPWPVVLWSFIGSIAAMIYRFNQNPIHTFGDAIKWMITRPIQGIVLGSTFYLILVSGLLVLTGVNPMTGVNPGESTDPVMVNKIINETILVLAFLVGFSDKFADGVFNTLVERYSASAKKNKENSDS